MCPIRIHGDPSSACLPVRTMVPVVPDSRASIAVGKIFASPFLTSSPPSKCRTVSVSRRSWIHLKVCSIACRTKWRSSGRSIAPRPSRSMYGATSVFSSGKRSNHFLCIGSACCRPAETPDNLTTPVGRPAGSTQSDNTDAAFVHTFIAKPSSAH